MEVQSGQQHRADGHNTGRRAYLDPAGNTHHGQHTSVEHRSATALAPDFGPGTIPLTWQHLLQQPPNMEQATQPSAYRLAASKHDG
jgi:hypothetical protein